MPKETLRTAPTPTGQDSGKIVEQKEKTPEEKREEILAKLTDLLGDQALAGRLAKEYFASQDHMAEEVMTQVVERSVKTGGVITLDVKNWDADILNRVSAYLYIAQKIGANVTEVVDRGENKVVINFGDKLPQEREPYNPARAKILFDSLSDKEKADRIKRVEEAIGEGYLFVPVEVVNSENGPSNEIYIYRYLLEQKGYSLNEDETEYPQGGYLIPIIKTGSVRPDKIDPTVPVIDPNKKIKIGFVGMGSHVERTSRDLAERELSESERELRGVTGFIKKIWKHNYFYEFYRQRGIARNRREILRDQNLFRDQDATGVSQRMTERSITERFLSDYEDEYYTERGEQKERLEDTPEVAEIKRQIRGLVIGYATGAITDENFRNERNRIIDSLGRVNGIPRGEPMFADNLLDVARGLRQLHEQGQSLSNLDLDFDLIVGRATDSVRTVERLTDYDRLLGRVQRSFRGLGGFLSSELVAASAISAIYSFGTSIGKVLTSSTASRVATLGGTMAVAGGMAGMRENKRFKEERSQTMREFAKGETFSPAQDRRRAEMSRSFYDIRSARELHQQLRDLIWDGSATEDDEDQSGDLTQTRFNQLIHHLAEIRARTNLSNRNNIDLIGYSSAGMVEHERAMLDGLTYQAISALENNNIDPAWLGGQQAVSELLHSITRTRELQLTEGERGLEQQDRIFNRMKNRSVAKAAVMGAMVGLGVGTAVQEIGALASEAKVGLVERLFKPGETFMGGSNITPLEWLREWVTGDSLPVPHHDVAIGEGLISLPEGYHIQQDEGGAYSLFKGNELVASDLTVDDRGALSTDSIKKLFDQNISFVREGFEVDTTNNFVGQPEDYVARHANELGFVERVGWYHNDTPAPNFDLNELKLWWGGEGNIGVSGNNFVMDMSHMTETGSFADGLNADAQKLLVEGKLRLLLSLSQGTQAEPFVLIPNADGTIEIPMNSEAGRILFTTDSDGHAIFRGRFAEIAELVGGNDSGATQVKILATYEGGGVESVTDMIPGVTEKVKNILDVPPQVDIPPIIPIIPRTPLGKTNRNQDGQAPLDNNPPPAPSPKKKPVGKQGKVNPVVPPKEKPQKDKIKKDKQSNLEKSKQIPPDEKMLKLQAMDMAAGNQDGRLFIKDDNELEKYQALAEDNGFELIDKMQLGGSVLLADNVFGNTAKDENGYLYKVKRIAGDAGDGRKVDDILNRLRSRKIEKEKAEFEKQVGGIAEKITLPSDENRVNALRQKLEQYANRAGKKDETTQTDTRYKLFALSRLLQNGEIDPVEIYKDLKNSEREVDGKILRNAIGVIRDYAVTGGRYVTGLGLGGLNEKPAQVDTKSGKDSTSPKNEKVALGADVKSLKERKFFNGDELAEQYWNSFESEEERKEKRQKLKDKWIGDIEKHSNFRIRIDRLKSKKSEEEKDSVSQLTLRNKRYISAADQIAQEIAQETGGEYGGIRFDFEKGVAEFMFKSASGKVRENNSSTQKNGQLEEKFDLSKVNFEEEYKKYTEGMSEEDIESDAEKVEFLINKDFAKGFTFGDGSLRDKSVKKATIERIAFALWVARNNKFVVNESDIKVSGGRIEFPLNRPQTVDERKAEAYYANAKDRKREKNRIENIVAGVRDLVQKKPSAVHSVDFNFGKGVDVDAKIEAFKVAIKKAGLEFGQIDGDRNSGARIFVRLSENSGAQAVKQQETINENNNEQPSKEEPEINEQSDQEAEQETDQEPEFGKEIIIKESEQGVLDQYLALLPNDEEREKYVDTMVMAMAKAVSDRKPIEIELGAPLGAVLRKDSPDRAQLSVITEIAERNDFKVNIYRDKNNNRRVFIVPMRKE